MKKTIGVFLKAILAGFCIGVGGNVFLGLIGTNKALGAVLFAVASCEFPPQVTLLLYFAMLSAIMSSADTTLFTAGGLLSQFFRSDMESCESVKLTRWCTGLLGVLAILIAIRCDSILTVLLFALGVYAGAFVVPVLWGLLGGSVDRRFAMGAILAGGTLALAGKILGGTEGNLLHISAFPVNLLILFLGRIPGGSGQPGKIRNEQIRGHGK